MELNKHKKKLKDLFDKFFQPGFELNTYYAENLLKYLEAEYLNKSAESILDTPFFSDLILYALTHIENATLSVRVFIIDTITIAVKNELQFSKLQCLQGFQMLGLKICTAHASSQYTPVQTASVRMLLAQISHYTGLNWVVNHKIWTYCLNPRMHRKSMNVTRLLYKYLANLVWKLNEYGEEAALVEVLQFITQPILNNQYYRYESINIEDEKNIYDPLLPYLNTLLAVLNEPELLRPNKVIDILHKYCLFEPPLHFILMATRDHDMTCLVSSILFRIILPMIKHNNRTATDVCNDLTVIYYNMVVSLVKKCLFPAIIEFIVGCIVYMAKLDDTLIPPTFERYGRVFETRNQIMILSLCPLIVYCKIEYGKRGHKEQCAAIVAYYEKLKGLTTEHVVKAGYAFKGLLETGDIKKNVIHTTRELLKLKGHLNEKQAGILYQILFYVLQLYVTTDESGTLIVEENPLNSPDDVKLLSLVLTAITFLLKEHSIKWYENVEIISLQNILVNLVKQKILPSKQLLQVLGLIDLSIKKFLSPDLALLMETIKTGSTLNEMANVIKENMLHEEWEVRDSALQLLLSCAELAYIKYIPLQRLLFENKLIVYAAELAIHDAEYYVQATALRCLAAVTKIDSLWKNVLTAHPNLYVQIIYILKNNPQGIVRKEAANIITEIYVHKKNCADFIKCMHTFMTLAALNDLHWEVQLAALKFWNQAIISQFSNRGMIDGKFPSVTFSKEKRKIVVLNQLAIDTILKDIMKELSTNGCLSVLDSCLNEESNIDVMDLAYSLTKKLIDILDCYKFTEVQNDVESTENSIQKMEAIDDCVSLANLSEEDNLLLREQVIDSIVNTNSTDLITEWYEQNTFENNFEYLHKVRESECLLSMTVRSFDPNVFIRNFKTTDYLSVIDSKKRWNSGSNDLDTLLDEILTLGEVNKDYTQDCNGD